MGSPAMPATAGLVDVTDLKAATLEILAGWPHAPLNGDKIIGEGPTGETPVFVGHDTFPVVASLTIAAYAKLHGDDEAIFASLGKAVMSRKGAAGKGALAGLQPCAEGQRAPGRRDGSGKHTFTRPVPCLGCRNRAR